MRCKGHCEHPRAQINDMACLPGGFYLRHLENLSLNSGVLLPAVSGMPFLLKKVDSKLDSFILLTVALRLSAPVSIPGPQKSKLLNHNLPIP